MAKGQQGQLIMLGKGKETVKLTSLEGDEGGVGESSREELGDEDLQEGCGRTEEEERIRRGEFRDGLWIVLARHSKP